MKLFTFYEDDIFIVSETENFKYNNLIVLSEKSSYSKELESNGFMLNLTQEEIDSIIRLVGYKSIKDNKVFIYSPEQFLECYSQKKDKEFILKLDKYLFLKEEKLINKYTIDSVNEKNYIRYFLQENNFIQEI